MDMRLRLYFDQFGQIPVPVPPVDEQRAILNFYNDATADTDRIINQTHREIELLREYRTRLIAEVVTGKVDVRDIPVENVPEDETLEEFVESEEMEEVLGVEEAVDADD